MAQLHSRQRGTVHLLFASVLSAVLRPSLTSPPLGAARTLQSLLTMRGNPFARQQMTYCFQECKMPAWEHIENPPIGTLLRLV